MGTVVITDGKYRASIAARMLGRDGYRVVVTQTRGDLSLEPPVFTSIFVDEGRWLDGSANDPDYPDRLYGLLSEYDRPVLFCVGAATLNAVSRHSCAKAVRGRAGPLSCHHQAPLRGKVRLEGQGPICRGPQ